MAITYSIDKTDPSVYTPNASAFFITPFYAVGTNKQPRKFTELEFQLVKPLRTDEGVGICYRVDLTAGFTLLREWKYEDIGAVISMNPIFTRGTVSIDIPSCENLQLKIALIGSNTTPELRTVILR